MSTRASRLLTKDGLKNQIGTRCHVRRMEIKLTQDGLCGRLAAVTQGGWIADRQEIGRIENGTRYVTTLELEALTQALDVTAEWIMAGEDADFRPKRMS
ncbi:MAG: helix-turn-helix domain-containing protein [Janthinobacterium lividum]